MEEIARVFQYSLDFYLKKVLLVALFSVPFFLAFLVPLLVPTPTYLAVGSLFVRSGSLPEFSIFDLIITGAGYIFAMFIISDTIVNINILVRSRRTLTETTQEMMSAISNHAMKIFYILTLVLLLHFIVLLLTYDMPLQSVIYPLFSFVVSYFLFFVPPAIVIDNSTVYEAIVRSVNLTLVRPLSFLKTWDVSALTMPVLIMLWVLFGAVLLVFSKLVGDFLFAGIFSQFLVLLLNTIVFLPFLIILQTQMYMEKYPLAR